MSKYFYGPKRCHCKDHNLASRFNLKNISFKFHTAQSHTTLNIEHTEYCKLNPSHLTLLKTAHFTF